MSGVRVRASIAAPSRHHPLEFGLHPDNPSRGARALALAHYIDSALEDGHYTSAGDIAAALGVTTARISQILALVQLPPSEQEAVLLGRAQETERSLRTRVPAAAWPDPRRTGDRSRQSRSPPTLWDTQ